MEMMVANKIPANHINWFDLSALGIYLAPELICGRPCILLLDTAAIFSTHKQQKGQLPPRGFMPVEFETTDQPHPLLFIYFSDVLDSSLFYKDLCLPPRSVNYFTAPLVDIQTVLYDHAKKIYGFRVDVLVRSAAFLGLNHLSNEVYTSLFGRFKVSAVGCDLTEKSYKLEGEQRNSIAFLRASTQEEVLACAQGFIKESILHRRNITLSDIIRFTEILFILEKSGTSVKSYQIFIVLSVINAIYIKHILHQNMTINYQDRNFFKKQEYYKHICFTFESSPSHPRAIYTDYLACQFNTPPPLSFVMQKLLVEGDAIEDNSWVLEPMGGYGSLVNMLWQQKYPITLLEIDQRKTEIVKEIGYRSINVHVLDSVNAEMAEMTVDIKATSPQFRYVICNPAFMQNRTRYQYKDNHGSIITDRSDIIVLLKSLMIRSNSGRSVYLLPCFNNPSTVGQQQHNEALYEVMQYVARRYHIDGVATISSDIYSKSLRVISPVLLVVADRRTSIAPATMEVVRAAQDTHLDDYEALWAWSELICYKRSPAYQQDFDALEHAIAHPPKIAYRHQVPQQEVVVTSSPKQTPIPTTATLDDIDGEFLPPSKAPLSEALPHINLSDSDALFSNSGDAIDDESNDGFDDIPTPADVDPSTDFDFDQEGLDGADGADGATDIAKTASDDAPPASNAISDDVVVSEDVDATPAPLPSSTKIAQSMGNYFDLKQQNHIIRYHGMSAMTEPTSNVLHRDFKSYLSLKHNLQQKIISSFSVMQPKNSKSVDKLDAYIKTHNVEVSVESFVGAHLDLGHPDNFINLFKSEHLDFISSAIIKFLDNKSILLIDSDGLLPEMCLAAMLRFYAINGRPVVYFAKNTSNVDKLAAAYSSLDSVLPSRIALSLLKTYETKSDDWPALFKSLSGGKLLVIVNDKDSMKKLKSNKVIAAFSKSPDFTSIFDADMSSTKYNSSIISRILKAPTIFRSTSFISSKTNLSTISTLFPYGFIERHLPPQGNNLDDMAIHLLKLNLIEDGSLFERYEDLSNVKVRNTATNKQWEGKHELLSQSYSQTINKIVVLSEYVHKSMGAKAPPTSKLALIRAMAIQIYDLCLFCITAIPLTHSIFAALKDNAKPVVVLPQNIEDTLFSLLENLTIEMPARAIEQDVHTLAELNQKISIKSRDFLEPTDVDVGTNDKIRSHLQSEIATLTALRSEIIFKYLTHNKSGELSKYPAITSLIAAFYKNCMIGLDDTAIDYDIIVVKSKEIELEISALTNLPLCIADFLRYELNRYQIKTAEISNRSFSVHFNSSSNNPDQTRNSIHSEDGWSVVYDSPFTAIHSVGDANQRIVDRFNAGDYDVIFVEADSIKNFDLSSRRNPADPKLIDYMRKRVLFLTYFNQPLSHYLSLIHNVNSATQFISPEVYFEVADSPVQNILASLLIDRLSLLNVAVVPSEKPVVDLSYYITDAGADLLLEYLDINPSYQAYYPALPISQWTLYNALNVVNMVDSNLQLEIVLHLAYFYVQHLDHLKNVKRNPFDLLVVSPKAKYQAYDPATRSELLYLVPPLLTNSSSPSSFTAPLNFSKLKYLKDVSDSFSLADCKSELINQSALEVTQLRTILSNHLPEAAIAHKVNEMNHAALVDMYANHYEEYLIGVYRDKVANLLQDRHFNWIFSDKNLNEAMIRSHFVHDGVVEVANTLQDIYIEICMVGDLHLIDLFERSCKVLTFLRAYQKTLAFTTRDDTAPLILMPVPSPFNDLDGFANEGFMLRVSYPSSMMPSLSPKAFSVSMAYPLKSKLISLNLSYVLNYQSALNSQSVLSVPSDRKLTAILRAYKNSKYKQMLTIKFLHTNLTKLVGFQHLNSLSSPDSHATVSAFDAIRTAPKLRTMDIIGGNLFEVYSILRDQSPLTLARLIDDKGVVQYGLAIPSDTDLGDVITSLIRTTSLSVAPIVYEQLSHNKASLKHLRTITWVGALGSLEATGFTSDEVDLTFKGSVHSLQRIFLDSELFLDSEETPNPSPSTNNSGSTPISLPANGSGQQDLLALGGDDLIVAPPQPLRSVFTPLLLSAASIDYYDNEVIYQFTVSPHEFQLLSHLLCKKKFYHNVMIDVANKSHRTALSLLIAGVKN